MNINLNTEISNCYLCNNKILYSIKVKDLDIKICPNCLSKLIVEMAESTHYDYVVFDAIEKLKHSDKISEIYKVRFGDTLDAVNKFKEAKNEIEALMDDNDSKACEIESLQDELSDLKSRIKELVS